MRVPLSWLGDWVDLPEDVSLESVHAALVKVGFEEEDVVVFDVSGPVVVGQVLEITPEPQTNGKTINWCSVDVGPSTGSGQARDIRGIVCGAHNFEVGDKVVVSLPGAVLPGPFPISARKTYGHVSDGMIASARELGLGDEHDGILRLVELGLDPEPGTDAIALLGLADAAVDINVTPDRGYGLSIRGIAREYSHSTGARFTDPVSAVTVAPADGFPLTVTDDAPIRGRSAVSTGSLRVVRGIVAGRPTPPWMRARLLLAGIRSVSLPVDITNYVMIELGQPTHGFDLAKLDGGITIRRARAGEHVTTLDGKDRTLDPQDMVVADDSGPIGLGGVMGGGPTEISAETVDVLVEALCWEPVSISRSVRRHKLPSEAAKRFERGVDPTLAPIAAQRVADLLVELAGGTIDSLGANWGGPPASPSIELPIGRAAALVGVEFTDDEVIRSLETIGASVVRSGDTLTVTPPSWRPDLTDPADLVEEVVRIVGYDRIPSVLPTAPPGRGLTRSQVARRRAAQTLAAAGATEVLSYPFQSAETVARFSPGAEAFRLENALDAREPFMRLSMLPGLIVVAQRNLSRGATDLALFEIGHIFGRDVGATAERMVDQFGTDDLPAGGVTLDAETTERMSDSVPDQPWMVGALFLGDAIAKQPGQPAVPAGLSDAFDAVRQLALALAVNVEFRSGTHPALHPGRTAEVLIGDAESGWHSVGAAGELLPSLAKDLDLPAVVAVLELDLDALIALGASQISATPIGTMPAATQDLSLVVADAVSAGDVLAAVIEGAGALLEDARLVDDYRGSGVPGGSKSLTFALRFRAADRTLTAAEATAAKLAGVALAAERFGATLRE